MDACHRGSAADVWGTVVSVDAGSGIELLVVGRGGFIFPPISRRLSDREERCRKQRELGVLGQAPTTMVPADVESGPRDDGDAL